MIGKYIGHKVKEAIMGWWPIIIIIMGAIGLLILCGIFANEITFPEWWMKLLGVILISPIIFVCVLLAHVMIRDSIGNLQDDYKEFKQSQSKDGEPE